MKFKFILLLCILLILVSTQALSQKEKPFCFRHKETHAIVRPCESFRSQHDDLHLIYCMDNEKSMKQFKPMNIDDWERLEGDICLLHKSEEDVPRGFAQKIQNREVKEDTEEDAKKASSLALTMKKIKKDLVAQLRKKIINSEKAQQIETKINKMSANELLEFLEQDIVKLIQTINEDNSMSNERKYLKELNKLLIKANQNGSYSKGIELAEKAYKYAVNNFGEKDEDTLISINNLAGIYRDRGNYAKAEQLYKRCLSLSEEILGPDDPSISITINNLGLLYKSQGKYSEAEQLYKKSLTISEEYLGSKHPFTITIINNLGALYNAQGKYAETESMYIKSLKLSEEILGLKHQDTLISINNLAYLYKKQGKYTEAEPLYEKCLKLREKILGKQHPDTLTSLHNLASLYKELGRYAEAEPLFIKCLQLSEVVFGKKHPFTFFAINGLASLYDHQGKYTEAERLYKLCFTLREKLLGPKHPQTLQSINNLSSIYQKRGLYSKAEPLLKNCLAIRKEILGNEHPDTITSISNLAFLYENQGKYAEAETLYVSCLHIRKKNLGPKNPDTLISMDNLANIYVSQRRYAEAELMYKRNLILREEVFGSRNPDTIRSINNLAGIYKIQGKYVEAEPLLKHCLQIREELFGPNHPDTLGSISSLANLYVRQKKYAESEVLYKHCLKEYEKVLGRNHPKTIYCINNLALLYKTQGLYAKSEPLLKRCLLLSEEVFGSKHPDTLSIMLNYSFCLVTLQEENKALSYLKSYEQLMLKYAGYILQNSEKLRVRRLFMSSKYIFQEALLSLAFQSNHPEIKAFAGDVILRWKCVQQEAETIINRIVHSSKDTRIVDLGNEIQHLRRQMNIFDKDIDMNELIHKLEQKEVKLAQLSNAYQLYMNKASKRLSDLTLILPPKTAVIELKQFRYVNYKTGQLGDFHFAAVLIQPNKKPVLQDLGIMKDIELLYGKMRSVNNQAVRNLASKELYNQLFGVFDKQIRQAKNIYICPDGLTHNISFSRLILPDGRFWIERQSLCRIQTSRDLFDPVKPINQGTLVAMGGIDYNQSPDITAKSNIKTYSELTNIRSIESTVEKIEYFKPLPSSTIEVELIKVPYQESQQKKAQIYKGNNASENQLKYLPKPPHVLHLATHGFYLNSHEDITERPMLLSGLALAGSNLGLQGKKGSGNDDGILYAIEVAGLNLTGTELVVLSACDTGKGTIDKSEGVYGLMRAFRLAGAHDIMMTLWSLKDQSASEFLSSFYKTWMWQSNMTPLKALRQTQLSFIKQNKDSSLWAPYVMVVGNIQ